jgi:DNA polymerase
MHDHALDVLLGLDLPQILDADAVDLQVGALAQVVFGFEMIVQMPAAAFGEQGVFGAQFHAGLEGVSGLAVMANAHVAGNDAEDAILVVVEHVGSGEAGVDLDAQALGLPGQPAGKRPKADDVVAVVLAALGQEGVGGSVSALC